MGMRLKRALRSAFVGLAVMAAAGCDDVLAGLSNTYTGPPPSREDITNEMAVIRRVRAQPETGIQFFLVERERFLETDPHHIDRVVEVTSRDIQAAVTPMQLAAGDRIRITTRFLSYRESGELGQYVSDWPYDKYDEYPIGFHLLTSVERLAP